MKNFGYIFVGILIASIVFIFIYIITMPSDSGILEPLSQDRSLRITAGSLVLLKCENGAAILEFTTFAEDGSKYKWKYIDWRSKKVLSGEGEVLENYRTLIKIKNTRHVRNRSTLRNLYIGPIALRWSHGGPKSCHIYFPNRGLSVKLIPNKKIDEYNIEEIGGN